VGGTIADVTGRGQPGPQYEPLLMLAPAVTIPLLLAPVMLCLNAWAGERRPESGTAPRSHPVSRTFTGR